VPAKSPASSAPTDAVATERLEAARAKVAANQLDAALADLRQILADFPGTATAIGASYMSAYILEQLGRDDEAIAAHEEFVRRNPSDPRAAASLQRTVELIARSRRPNREAVARDLLSQVISNYPRTPLALQALLIRMKTDTDRRQRELDPVLGIQVPAALPTLRSLTEQFPTHPTSMMAFNRLASFYEDLDQYQRQAQALSDLGANFPNNPYDSWYRLGEVYERRLKDPARASEAYAKVPQSSSRYRDAQRKLGNR
jgi:tetratricopeptide (TPR) repeat protein